MKPSIIKSVLGLSLSLILLSGCANTNTVTNLQKKNIQQDEIIQAQNKIINAQDLIQKKKYVDAQKLLDSLVLTSTGKTNIDAQVKKAESLLEQIKKLEAKQAKEAEKQASQTANSTNSQAQNNTTTSNNSSTNEAFTYASYTNPRFGFTVQYPNGFTMGPEPTNGDGRDFSNGEAKITASGIRVVDNENIQTELQFAVSNIGNSPISYQKTGSNWFVLSYTDKNNNIVYQKSTIQNGISYDLYIMYPASQQTKYSPMLDHIVNTFAPGNGEN